MSELMSDGASLEQLVKDNRRRRLPRFLAAVAGMGGIIGGVESQHGMVVLAGTLGIGLAVGDTERYWRAIGLSKEKLAARQDLEGLAALMPNLYGYDGEREYGIAGQLEDWDKDMVKAGEGKSGERYDTMRELTDAIRYADDDDYVSGRREGTMQYLGTEERAQFRVYAMVSDVLLKKVFDNEEQRAKEERFARLFDDYFRLKDSDNEPHNWADFMQNITPKQHAQLLYQAHFNRVIDDVAR